MKITKTILCISVLLLNMFGASLGAVDVKANDIIYNTDDIYGVATDSDANGIDNFDNYIEEAQIALQEIAGNKTIMALVYLSDEYHVKSAPDSDSDTIATIASGHQVHICGVEQSEYGVKWMKVMFYSDGIEYSGYVERNNLACSDADFLEWEDTHFSKLFRMSLARAVSYPDIEQFPESYRAQLIKLKQAHPNWTFVKMNTKLDWQTVINEEMTGGKSLVPTSFPAYMQTGIYGQGWSFASESILKYYMDPRNWLTENGIFQFEQLTYNSKYHNKEAVQTILNSGFMKGKIPGMSMTYANAFFQIGKELGVSPYHLASRVYQEQGKGTSPLISGKYPGYEGYYNYFNIAASGTSNEAVYTSGLKKAKEEGWTDGYKSLCGGAKILANNYILRGQDTLYLQKFNVDSSTGNLYWHQYMQNICAPSNECLTIRKSYVEAGALDNNFVFKIPVYDNMPTKASTKPVASTLIKLTPPAGYTDTNIYIDGIEYKATKSNGQLSVNASDTAAKTAVMYKYNDANVPVGMYVWTLTYSNNAYTAKAQPELQDLLTYHGFSIRIVGKAGIRFKTGINSDLRNRLTGSGVNGYSLKEYGTLVMNDANRSQTYPLIKDGEKVAFGRSYGVNDSGVLEDKIYETVQGRHRYTSVLVGLPATQYKTEFAFRGYITLKDSNNKQITIYGPIVSRSIYSLAKQVVASGQFAPTSSAGQFLDQLIKDGDNVK